MQRAALAPGVRVSSRELLDRCARDASHFDRLAARARAGDYFDGSARDAERLRDQLDHRSVRFTVDGRRGDRDLEPAVVEWADLRAGCARLHEHVERHGAVVLLQIHFPWRPSSRARFVAVSTALMSVVRRPPSSSVCKPAIAVPPGDVTMSLSRPGCSSVSSNSLAEPITVCAARRCALRRESPTLTPASASASRMRKMYAGPEPDRPVTASSRFSSSWTV